MKNKIFIFAAYTMFLGMFTLVAIPWGLISAASIRVLLDAKFSLPNPGKVFALWWLTLVLTGLSAFTARLTEER